ncbi:molybdopterin-binding/glycosyltransferase family 2 protein [Chelativorans sp. M5D2P16]|uniref:molybdopterin-binding/glycosyltransferase family 2 protein n=1 Tax=Chelativorans sp. M5D2P16 TaxID=3095678 RepID=UPI002ACAE553|nr:molybdopterin-binding/glycosyltransferase family 2 protein [Chelativorans sp. M5D2P16]MDZ5696466.1 molybdopterin-binding/glycosyltransferase family 2 protein [Chelativorans sp. M5D2P16]
MRFGAVPVCEAEGAILAHATMAGEKRLRKAHRLTAQDVRLLEEAGVREVIAAVLAPDDLDEDAAAARIAAALRVATVEARAPATGRVNLHAAEAGLFRVDKHTVDAVNRIDPAITLATLEPFAAVEAGQMVATVKIIPFAVPENLVAQVETACAAGEAFSVQPFVPRRIGLVQTVLPGVKPSVLDKTARITEARLARSASRVTVEVRPPHEEEGVARAIADQARDSDMVLVFGASAVCDEDDVIPAAIRRAGGKVSRVGMPVDPGNLLVIGSLDGKPVLGAPGCARSPKPNGFDWVLDRLMAGLEVTHEEVGAMGVGGLLVEIPTRPQPREVAPKRTSPKVWAVLLAAGRSRRMGIGNKLMAEFDGKPLVRRVAEQVTGGGAAGVVVVLGHEAERISAALSGLTVKEVQNPHFRSGLASSLKAGIRALPPSAAGALVVLGDMPEVTAEDFNRLLAAFSKAGGEAIVRATHGGKRGNPVILPRTLFAEVERLEGDTGARQIVESAPLEVVDVELGPAASLDVDTPEALHAAGGTLKTESSKSG